MYLLLKRFFAAGMRGRTAKMAAGKRGWDLGDEGLGAGRQRGGSWEKGWKLGELFREKIDAIWELKFIAWLHELSRNVFDLMNMYQ